MNAYPWIEDIKLGQEYFRDFNIKSLGMSDGKGAALIFLSLRSELYDDENDREKAQELFTEIIRVLSSNRPSPDRTLLTGDTGAVRAVTFLSDLGLIEQDPDIDRILRLSLERRNFINSIPSIPMPDPDVYGEAIAYLSLFRDEDETLERYSLQEYLISLTDNCLRLLEDPVPPLYHPKDMRPSFRHSILRFAMGIRDKGIFPYKAQRIISSIRYHVAELENSSSNSDIHSAILRSLLGDHNAVTECLRRQKDNALLEDLAQLALFSMAYSLPWLLAEGLEGTDPQTLTGCCKYAIETNTDPSPIMTLASGLMYLEMTPDISPITQHQNQRNPQDA